MGSKSVHAVLVVFFFCLFGFFWVSKHFYATLGKFAL